MLRAALPVLLALQLLPATHLVVLLDPPPDRLVAGQEATIAGTVHLEGPLGPLPGVSDEVELTLEASEHAGCTVQPRVLGLDPATGKGAFELVCRSGRPGTFPVTLTATSRVHGTATTNLSLGPAPDDLEAQATVGQPSGFQAPIRVTAHPVHLDEAPLRLTLSGHHADTGLALPTDTVNLTEVGSPWSGTWTAIHGPGTYHVVIGIDGPWTKAWRTELTVEVPAPPDEDELVLNVTVPETGAQVRLTGDSVNADGKQKGPGDELITRLSTQATDQVLVQVLRSQAGKPVLLDEQVLEPDGSGAVEHRFSWPTLPAGEVWVQATAGNASAVRTAIIQDEAPDLQVASPGQVLGDGRVLTGTAWVNDTNLGSTPLDPGPVFGLEDLTWTVFHGSRPSPGWRLDLGPFNGGSEGTAELSAVSWPKGGQDLAVSDGSLRMPLALAPDPQVDPGTYRLSFYDPSGDRIGGHTWELVAPPSVHLTAEEPVPGRPWRGEIDVRDRVQGTSLLVQARVAGELVDEAARERSGNVSLALPAGLPAGTPVSLEAWASWPGRPIQEAPDGLVTGEVPELAPRLDPVAQLDGGPAPWPVPVHPAGAHTLVVHPRAVDPNGGPVSLQGRIMGPAGQAVEWPMDLSERLVVEVPAGQPSGRYLLELTADDGQGRSQVQVPIDVASVGRLGITGPREVQLEEQGPTVVPVTVANTGTLPFEGLLLELDGPPELTADLVLNGQEVALGQVTERPLPAGDGLDGVLELSGSVPPGAYEVRLRVAGVVG